MVNTEDERLFGIGDSTTGDALWLTRKMGEDFIQAVKRGEFDQ